MNYVQFSPNGHEGMVDDESTPQLSDDFCTLPALAALLAGSFSIPGGGSTGSIAVNHSTDHTSQRQ